MRQCWEMQPQNAKAAASKILSEGYCTLNHSLTGIIGWQLC